MSSIPDPHAYYPFPDDDPAGYAPLSKGLARLRISPGLRQHPVWPRSYPIHE